MRVRVTSLFLAVLLAPTVAFAESHKADLFGGGSGGTGGSKIGGYIVGVNWGTCVPWIDVVGPTVSTQYGGHDGKSLTQTAYHGGVRLTLTSMQRDRAAEKAAPSTSQKYYVDKDVKPFVHFLVGGVYSNINDGSGQALKDWSVTIGGGVDKFFHKVSLNGRDHVTGVGFRVQYDYVVRSGDSTNFHRVSAGVVWRILKEHK
jgi:hypothetical protein